MLTITVLAIGTAIFMAIGIATILSNTPDRILSILIILAGAWLFGSTLAAYIF